MGLPESDQQIDFPTLPSPPSIHLAKENHCEIIHTPPSEILLSRYGLETIFEDTAVSVQLLLSFAFFSSGLLIVGEGASFTLIFSVTENGEKERQLKVESSHLDQISLSESATLISSFSVLTMRLMGHLYDGLQQLHAEFSNGKVKVVNV